MATHNQAEKIAAELLRQAGVKINGENPWDFQVKNPKIFERVLSEGTLGLGESYMDGWWEAPHLDEFFFKVLSARLREKMGKDWHLILGAIYSRVFNLQSKKRAFQIGEKHYDTGNDLYRLMLDSRLVYTCGYWKNATTLDEAQEAKLKLTCDKLNLKPGLKVLDIGCGWGSFAKYAAENYGVSVVGVTVSGEQVALARETCANLPIEIRLQDYRDVNEKFDRIVSLGMFEHVGYKNYPEFFKVANRCLKNDGLLLLHTIGNRLTEKSGEPWILKYIFPNSMLPSIKQIGAASEKLFIMEDWHNFGADYDLTLMAWHANFEKNWDRLKDNYDERFHRMWRYYLLSFAGVFRARTLQLWQIVFSKTGVPGGYESIR